MQVGIGRHRWLKDSISLVIEPGESRTEAVRGRAEGMGWRAKVFLDRRRGRVPCPGGGP